MNQHQIARMILLCLFVFSTRLTAQTDPLAPAFDQLRAFQPGGDPQPFKTVEAAVVRSHADPALRATLLPQLESLLTPAHSFDTRQFACRQLALIATDKQIPALTPLLGDDQLASLALYALARIPGPAVDQALLDTLTTTPDREKLGLINTLGHRRNQSAIPVLATLLDGSDPALATEAALALGRIGSPAATQPLLAALAQTNHPAQPVIPRACLLAAGQRLTEGQSAQAAALYRQLYNTTTLLSPDRAATLQGLWITQPDETAPLLLQALQSPDRPLCQMAIHLIHDNTTPQQIDRLVNSFPLMPPTAQILFLQALPARPVPALLPLLRLALDNSFPGLPLAALQALGATGDPAAIPLLIQYAASPSDPLQQAARQSLTAFPGPEASAAILAQLPTAQPSLQATLISILEERQAAETAPQLLPYASSPDAQVRAATLKALRSLAGPAMTEPLVDLLPQAAPADIAPLRSILAALARRHDQSAAITQTLLDRLKTLDQPARRIPLLLALGDLGQPTALPVLLAALHDPEPTLGYAALQALTAWPDPSPLDDLFKVARDHPLPTHRILALRACIRLLDNAPSMPPDQKLPRLQTVMELTPPGQDQKAILAAVAKLPTLPAMEFAQRCLAQESLKSEAAQAIVQIARQLVPQHPAILTAALNGVIQTQVPPALQDQALALLDEIKQLQSYLTDWQVAGPYFLNNKTCQELFDIPFAPEIPDTSVTWQPMPIARLDPHPAYLDLLQTLHGGEQRVAYLRTQIDAPAAQTVRLEIFSDDGVKAWLNGYLIHANNTLRPILADPDTVEITLQKGANTLLLKITQNNLPWGAIVRLR